MNTKQIKTFSAALLVIALLGSCDFVLGPEPADNNAAVEGAAAALGNLTVNLGAGDTGRAISSGADLPADVLSSLRYELTLIGPGDETLTRTVAAGGTLNVTVAIGSWRIDAEAYQDTGVLAGTGSVEFTVGPGPNTVRVPMNMEGDCYEITVDSDTVHGTVRSNFTAAFPGTTITITAEEDPDAVWIDGSLAVIAPLSTVTVSGSGTSGSFTMPAEDVGLYADFRQFVRYVRAGGAGYETGASWDDASGDLQKMMDDLERPIPGYSGPRIVKLGAGTYKPEWTPVIRNVLGEPYPYTYTAGGGDAAFILREAVEVWGGYPASGGEDSSRNIAANSTTLSGDLNNDNSISYGDAYHIVLGVNIPAAGGTVLDGLTISGGNADGGGVFSVNSVSISRQNGGGMFNDNASPKLNRVTISGNTATVDGGGMYNYNGSSPELVNVTIGSSGSPNTASIGGGGGMFNHESSPKLEDVTISYNISARGGGINNSYDSSPILTGVLISGNTAASGHGGGIFNIGSSTEPVLKDVTISDNTAAASGGGIYNEDSSPVLVNVTISGNEAVNGGGGIFNNGSSSAPALVNVLISGNKANEGGGLENDQSSPVLINVTIAGNQVYFDGGGIYNTGTYSETEIYNSIVWGNSVSGISDTGGSNTLIGDSIIQGSGSDPQFAAPLSPALTTGGNYQLNSGSPAINAGDSDWYPISASVLGVSSYEARLAISAALLKDLAGNTRVQGAAIDMGAYEKE